MTTTTTDAARAAFADALAAYDAACDASRAARDAAYALYDDLLAARDAADTHGAPWAITEPGLQEAADADYHTARTAYHTARTAADAAYAARDAALAAYDAARDARDDACDVAAAADAARS